MALLNKLRLNQEYSYFGRLEEGESKLLALDGVRVEKIGNNKYKLRPVRSLGVLMTSGAQLVDGINVNTTVTEMDKNKQAYLFTTTIRVEHFFIATLFLLFLIGMIAQHEPYYTFLFLLGLWVIFHSWFQMIYRYQEKAIVDEAVQKMRLNKIN